MYVFLDHFGSDCVQKFCFTLCRLVQKQSWNMAPDGQNPNRPGQSNFSCTQNAQFSPRQASFGSAKPDETTVHEKSLRNHFKIGGYHEPLYSEQRKPVE